MHFVLIGATTQALAMTPAGPYTIPGPIIGSAFSFNMTITGGVAPYTVTTSGGNGLPPGLSMNASTGAITGTPTAPGGSYAWNVSVTDSASNNRVSVNINTTVYSAMVANPASSALTARPEGTAFSQILTTSGGSGGYTYAVVSNSLPPGVVLDPNGTISGTPSGQANYGFMVRRTDNVGHILDTYYIITVTAAAVVPPPGPAIGSTFNVAGSGSGMTDASSGGGASDVSPGTQFTITNLPFTYNVTATDGNGGSASYTADMSGVAGLVIGQVYQVNTSITFTGSIYAPPPYPASISLTRIS